ncbi:PAS/PAC sensor signal transduction histidine kinase [Flammeovirgaceae bacterium 311]|nr:PAS/PAC sensor signal transduction histidine kinase [Flammeovirgaceae bacterium 311]
MEQGLQLHVYTKLLDQLPGLHWWQSLGGDSYAFAPACRNLAGFEDSLTPRQWQSLVHPNDQRRRKSVLQLAPDQEKNITYRFLTKSGTYEWVQESIRHIQSADAGAVLLSTAAICKEPVYRAFFDNTSLFMVLLDPAGNIRELNKISKKFLGHEEQEVWDKPLWESACFKEENQNTARIRNAVMKAATGEQVDLQEWIINYNGLYFRGRFSIKPVFDQQGQLEYLFIEGSDISHKRTLDQEWFTLAENIPDVITRFDQEYRYLFANPAIENFTGKKSSEYLGKRIGETNFPDPSWDGFETKLQKAMLTGQMQTYAGKVKSPKQEIKDIYSLLVPELDERGKVASVLVITRDITELAQKEKDLEQINARLRAIIEGTKDIICALDTDKKLIAYNAAYAEEMQQLFGVEVKPKQSIEELLSGHPEELKNALDLWKRALKGEEFAIQQEFGLQDRERNYYEINFSSIRDEEGKLIGASSRTINISRERQIEKELKDAHEFLVLAENLPQVIFTARPDGQIDYLNNAFFKYTNLPQIHAVEVDWKKILHPEDYAGTMEQWFDAIKYRAPGLQLELRLRNRHGLYRWHIARAVPLYNNQKATIKWVGIISDVHEAKIAGELERMAAEEFKTISESLPHIVWTTHADGRATYFNQKWYDYTGEDEVVTNEWDWLKFVHPEDKSRTQKTWKKAITSRTYYQVEYRLFHKSGRYRWFLARGVPVTDAAGNVIKWFGTCTDIHENKLQRKRLQTQNERLNQINQYLDNFVHAAAHDLRSPVANMKGLLQLLSGNSKEKRSKIIESMETSLYRLDNTLQAMIHSIELQSLKQSPAKKLSFRDAFTMVHQELQERLQPVPHEIQANFENCPDIVFIPFYLESLFRNLLSNAIKYRKEDEKLVIRISCRTFRNYKLLEFSDNGIGIDVEKYKNKLFRPFQRFTAQAGGKGIGLHLINNIVTKTGGKVEVISQPGKGTTFRLFLKNLEG